MFVITVAANSSFLMSIVLRFVPPVSASIGSGGVRGYVSNKLPWMADAVGCILCDLIILLQFLCYRHRHEEAGARSAGGLVAGGDTKAAPLLAQPESVSPGGW